MPNTMNLQQIRPDFSNSNHTFQSAQRSMQGVGNLSNEWLDRLAKEKAVATEEARYQTEQARQKVLDDRATTLWDEQQKEKENLLMAGQLKSNPLALQEAVLAQDPKFNTAMTEATNAGLDTGTMGVKGVMDWYGQQTPVEDINISQAVPNVGGTAGSAITKNVARQVPVDVPVQQPVVKQPIESQGQVGLVTPTEVSSTDYTNALQQPISNALTTYEKVNTNTPLGLAIKGVRKVGDYLTGTSRGNSEWVTKTPGRSEAYLNPKAPMVDKQIKAEYKAQQVLAPQTPKQQEASKTQMKTIMEKVVVGHTSGTPPKLNQIEAATIDKIFAGIDPNVQSRESAKTSIEGLYYSLGLNPKQVKEYAEGTVESVYGDKNDPIKLAVANAKLGALEKNVESSNRLGTEIYKEGQANSRQAAQLSASAKQHRETLNATKDKESAFLKAFDSKSGALTAEMEADPVGFADKQEKSRRDKWAGRYKEKYGDEGLYDNIFNNQSDWIDSQIAAENLKIEKQRADKKSK